MQYAPLFEVHAAEISFTNRKGVRPFHRRFHVMP